MRDNSAFEENKVIFLAISTRIEKKKRKHIINYGPERLQGKCNYSFFSEINLSKSIRNSI